MLINYTFNNCFSFKKETSLSLETGERLRKYPENTMKVSAEASENSVDLLKNILIFGSNGSGKTNLLRSLNLMKKIILKIPPKITSKIPQSVFLMDDFSTNDPTYFEIEFIQNSLQYRYSFSYSNSKILTEKLELYAKNKYKVYFERAENNNYIKLPKQFKKISNEIRDNVLIIQKGQDQNDKYCIDIFKWFEETLTFFSKKNSEDLFYLLKDTKNKKSFLKLLSLADMNIIDVEVETSVTKLSEYPEEIQTIFKAIYDNTNGDNNETSEYPETSVEELYTTYKRYNSNGDVIGAQRLRLDRESAGTRKMIYIALNILFCQENNNKVLIFDEFDNAFHQELSEALIKIFNSEGNRNQFILTTHDLDLMDKKLRRDQIYLVEKDFSGESELFSLFDFDDFKKTRGDTTFYKRYMKGSFGAIPNIDSDEMLKMFS